MESLNRLRAQVTQMEPAEGLALLDILNLPHDLQAVLDWILRRREVGAAEVAAELAAPTAEVGQLLDSLVAKGCLRRITPGGGVAPRYALRLATKPGRRLDERLWKAISEGPVT